MSNEQTDALQAGDARRAACGRNLEAHAQALRTARHNLLASLPGCYQPSEELEAFLDASIDLSLYAGYAHDELIAPTRLW